MIENFLKEELRFKGDFIGGEWVLEPEFSRSYRSHSPANVAWQFPVWGHDVKHVDRALSIASEAFGKWKQVSLEERVECLVSFQKILEKRSDEIGRLVALETGKPFAEAKGEAGALAKKIAVTIESGLKLVSVERQEFPNGMVGETHWRPKGVLAIIGPFNFPVHLSNGQIVPALLMGNVCVLKPSERTPFSAQAYMDAFREAGFPPGVLQMLHGDAGVAQRLIRSPMVDGVLATCSYDVGAKIQESVARETEKIVALEMGGKNAAIVWDAEDLDSVAKHIIDSSFLTTGQRCTALSRCYVKRNLMGDLVNLVHEKTKQLVIGDPFMNDPAPYMGPIISEAALENYLKYQDIAEKDGAETLMRPKRLSGKLRMGNSVPDGYYVCPAIHIIENIRHDSPYQSLSLIHI